MTRLPLRFDDHLEAAEDHPLAVERHVAVHHLGEAPFDGKRMIFGGFKMIVEA